MINEQNRIKNAYKKRAAAIATPQNYLFAYQDMAHLYRIQQRYRRTISLLHQFGYHDLHSLKILDVGCGNGSMLRQFLQWGAQPEHLSGIELRPEPVSVAKHLNPNIDYRVDSATTLPFADQSNDIVCLNTVFTSIFNPEMKKDIVAEIERVLKPNGSILWYDFMYDNPKNPDVKGVTKNEIISLFHNFNVHVQKITLAPFVARKIPASLLSIIYPTLFLIPILRTHYLGLFKKL